MVLKMIFEGHARRGIFLIMNMKWENKCYDHRVPRQDFTVENIYGVLGIDFNGQEQVEQYIL